MKMNHLLGLFILAGGLLIASCAPTKGLTVKGNLENAQNLSIFFDKKDINNTITSLDKMNSSEGGAFSFNFPEGVTPGVYRVRVGAKSVDLILDGTEKTVNINGNLNNLQSYDYKIEGAPLAEEYRAALEGLSKKTIDPRNMQNFLVNETNPLVAMSLATTIFAGNAGVAPIHKAICEKLEAKYPAIDCTQQYKTMVTNLEKQANRSSGRKYNVSIGDQAPEIALPDLTGKTRKLSELQGNIVLIDFWASWCGPCRRANPGVVETYHKYKDQGFRIFSVSLDGLDARTKGRFGGDQAKIDKQMESSKTRWKDAIAKDKLVWNDHVSDLKKWDSQAAGAYGVRSIPTTFLLDREGKVAALNPRHTQIEAELLKLL